MCSFFTLRLSEAYHNQSKMQARLMPFPSTGEAISRLQKAAAKSSKTHPANSYQVGEKSRHRQQTEAVSPYLKVEGKGRFPLRLFWLSWGRELCSAGTSVRRVTNTVASLPSWRRKVAWGGDRCQLGKYLIKADAFLIHLKDLARRNMELLLHSQIKAKTLRYVFSSLLHVTCHLLKICSWHTMLITPLI